VVDTVPRGVTEFEGPSPADVKWGDMATASVAAQRWTAVLILWSSAVFSLPVTAFFFDGEGSENWILPSPSS
jgi:hypothetical protein